MTTTRTTTTARLPQLEADLFLTDGGIETTLIFDEGVELPDFAAFVLLDTDEGRGALRRYFEAHLAVAARDGLGIVLETPTWRASADWVARQGGDLDAVADINRTAVRFVRAIAAGHAAAPVLVSGCIGPRGDGYVAGEQMPADVAHAYHAVQARAFAEAGADLVTAITMTYPAEAIGVARAARDVGLPAVISFTTETDGRLPDGTTLREAVEAVDDATGAAPAYYMVNCAHPVHFAHVLEPGARWTARIRGLRANASTLSHAELDEAVELDPGDPADLASRYAELRATHPQLTVVGGCCGTSHVHIGAISAACRAQRGAPAGAG